ncbi:MAG: carboxypeptidase-like regulatory domain-containing protein [Acidobacteriota bacterium]
MIQGSERRAQTRPPAVFLVLISLLFAFGAGAAQAGTLSGFVGKPQLPAAPLPGIAVLLFDAQRAPVAQTTSAADGTFSFTGLAAGNYYLLTRKDDDDRVDLAWPDEPCPKETCGSFSDATAIPVPASGGVTIAPPFLLPLGVTFSGTVTAAVGGAGLQAQIFGMPSSQNFQLTGNTDAAGHYSIPGYPTLSGGNPITYKVRASPFGIDAHYIGEVWNNIPCPHASCDLNTVGTPVDVQGGDPVLDFALDDGSTISGHAYDGPGNSTPVSALGLTVWVYDLGSTVEGVASVFGDGSYSVRGLAAGSYRAVLVSDDQNSFFASQIFDGMPCFGASCVPPTGGTAIVLGTTATATADFHLASGMRIEGGMVNGATGADVFFGPHVFAGAAPTDLGHNFVSGGHYALTLPPGPAVRLGVLTAGEYVDQMWHNHPCAGTCPGTAGELISIVPGTVFVADFKLDPGALNFFALAPCRALDTRTLADPLPSGTTRSYALGAGCGVPFDAVAIAVNVTVVTPPATGSLALWASEAATTGTTVSNFKAGITRANNAVVSVGHDVATGLNARLTMATAGSAHLVIDITGYFVRPPA